MKVFFLRLVGFGFFSVLVYGVLLILFGLFAPKLLAGNLFKYNREFDYTYTRLKEADRRKNNIDILILGSSHAYRGYDTRIFQKSGYKTFNLGTSSQTLIQTKYLLNKYLAKWSPKLVILDFYPVILKGDGIESLIELLSVTTHDKEIFNMAIKSKDIKVYNTLLFYTLGRIFFNKKVDLPDLPSAKNKYIAGGYVENHSIGRKYSQAKVELSFSKEQAQCLKDILDMLKRKQTKCLMIQSPVTKRKYDSYMNVSDFDRTMSSLGDYHNFNKEQILQDSCFLDDNHLNSSGVKIYDEYVCKKARELLK